MINKKLFLYQIILAVFVSVLTVGAVVLAQAWIEPTSGPPDENGCTNCNIPAPINVGPYPQEKKGDDNLQTADLSIHRDGFSKDNPENPALLEPDILSTRGGAVINSLGLDYGLTVRGEADITNTSFKNGSVFPYLVTGGNEVYIYGFENKNKQENPDYYTGGWGLMDINKLFPGAWMNVFFLVHKNDFNGLADTRFSLVGANGNQLEEDTITLSYREGISLGSENTDNANDRYIQVWGSEGKRFYVEGSTGNVYSAGTICTKDHGCVGDTGNSPWARNQNYVYLNNLTDKVGIGVANPSSKLYIYSDIGASGIPAEVALQTERSVDQDHWGISHVLNSGDRSYEGTSWKNGTPTSGSGELNFWHGNNSIGNDVLRVYDGSQDVWGDDPYPYVQIYTKISNGSIILKPNGTGGLMLTDDGLKRGDYAVDLTIKKEASNSDDVAGGYASALLGGYRNKAYGKYSAVLGGNNNTVYGEGSVIIGGYNNFINGTSSLAVGGENKMIGEPYASVAMGWGNKVSSNKSFALGYRAEAKDDGSFVFADHDYLHRNYHLQSNGEQTFNVYASGGVYFFTDYVSNGQKKVEIKDGDIYVDNSTKGIILKSPNGTCYRVTVSDGGALTTSSVSCPQ